VLTRRRVDPGNGDMAPINVGPVIQLCVAVRAPPVVYFHPKKGTCNTANYINGDEGECSKQKYPGDQSSVCSHWRWQAPSLPANCSPRSIEAETTQLIEPTGGRVAILMEQPITAERPDAVPRWRPRQLVGQAVLVSRRAGIVTFACHPRSISPGDDGPDFLPPHDPLQMAKLV